MNIAQGLREEGMQQGKIAEKKEIARQLLKKGVEKDIIKFSTGLSDEELNQLI